MMIKTRIATLFALAISVVLCGCSSEAKLDRNVVFHNMSLNVPSDMLEERTSEYVWSFSHADKGEEIDSYIILSHWDDDEMTAEESVLQDEQTYIINENPDVEQSIDAYVNDPFVLDGREVASTRYEVTDTWSNGNVNEYTISICAIVGAGEKYVVQLVGDYFSIEDLVDTVSFTQ